MAWIYEDSIAGSPVNPGPVSDGQYYLSEGAIDPIFDQADMNDPRRHRQTWWQSAMDSMRAFGWTYRDQIERHYGEKGSVTTAARKIPAFFTRNKFTLNLILVAVVAVIIAWLAGPILRPLARATGSGVKRLTG